MMHTESIEQWLVAHGIRPTSNRLLVVREMQHVTEPLSLKQLDERILTMDRSSIFRVLQLLSASRLLHEIDDGSGAVKYEFCTDSEADEDHHQHDDEHVHFFCENCHHTFCLQDTPIPEVDLPEGFRVRSSNYVIHGLCPNCR
jgi:Fur family ferric uptake transcriptional regulator